MKINTTVAALATTLLLSSCSSQLATFTGSTVGGAVGAVLGERMGGWGGQIIGSALGSVIGAQAGNGIANKMEANQAQANANYYAGDTYAAGTATRAVEASPINVSIAKIAFQDQNGDNAISANETCLLQFELANNGNTPLYMITPQVQCDNLNVMFSKASTIQVISPGKSVRYTTQFIASSVKRRKTGDFSVWVNDANGNNVKVAAFSIGTK